MLVSLYSHRSINRGAGKGEVGGVGSGEEGRSKEIISQAVARWRHLTRSYIRPCELKAIMLTV